MSHMFKALKPDFSAPQFWNWAVSVFALALICVPLTIGAIWAFPIWDDAWLWLLLNEKGAGMITTSVADRPVMATLWSLLGTFEHTFWHVSLFAQALLWPTFGIISAVLWTYFFPSLRQYAMVVACVTVAPIISKVQMVTAVISLGTLLSVVLSYGAFLLLLGFVVTDRPFGRAAFSLSIPILGFAILLQEYALPVVIVMVIFFWSYARRGPDPATRARAWRAIFFLTLTTGAAYTIFFMLADFTARPGGATTSPLYTLALGKAHLVHFPFKLGEGLWRSVAGGFLNAVGEITLNSKLGVMAAAYGALVAGLLFYGSRNAQ